VFAAQLRALVDDGSLAMTWAAAEAALDARFGAAPPWRLIDVLR
jgi:hypothetical protein